METYETCFPFKCSTKGCGAEYDIQAFSEVALFWGFIFVTSGLNHIVGITCPQCGKTTVKKLSPVLSDFAIPLLEQHATKPSHFGFAIRPNFRFWVPFSPRIIQHHGLANYSDLLEIKDELFYTVPFGVDRFAVYPKEYFGNGIPASDDTIITRLLEIENSTGLRAFPRIIGDRNPYFKLEKLLKYLKFNDDLDEFIISEIDEILAAVIKPCFVKNDTENSDEKKVQYAGYEHMIKNDMDSSEYSTLNPTCNSFQAKHFPILLELLNEYVINRNGLLFEINFRNDFLNKYAREIYGKQNIGTNGYVIGYLEEFDLAEIQNAASNCINIQSETKNEDQARDEKNITQAEKFREIHTQKFDHHKYYLVRDGQKWYAKFDEEKATLNTCYGLDYLALLLYNPGRSLNNIQIMQITRTKSQIYESSQIISKDNNFEIISKYETNDDEIETLFSPIIKFYNNKIRDSKFSEYSDIVDNFNQQKIFFEKETGLKIYITKNGELAYKKSKYRASGKDEKARQNIKNNINNAITNIKVNMPKFATHLNECKVLKSFYSIYDPSKSELHKDIIWHIST